MATPGSPARPPLRILADHREASGGVVDALAATEGVEVSFTHLPIGDYRAEDALYFERKTWTDLAASIKDGRLFRQAQALAQLPAPARGILIIEGAGSGLSIAGMRRESVLGALITVTVFFGVPLLRSVSAEESARLMVYTARQAALYATGALPRKGKRPKGKRKAQLSMLQGLPGVGPGRAEHLLDHFGSVEAVLTADARELAEVAGVGQRTARGIRWIVSEAQGPPYA